MVGRAHQRNENLLNNMMMKAQLCFTHRNKEPIRANTERVGGEPSMEHAEEDQHTSENEGGSL